MDVGRKAIWKACLNEAHLCALSAQRQKALLFPASERNEAKFLSPSRGPREHFMRKFIVASLLLATSFSWTSVLTNATTNGWFIFRYTNAPAPQRFDHIRQ